MATTNPDLLPSPDLPSQYAPIQAFNNLAAATQAALIRRANMYLGTSSERTSFTAQAPEGAWWQDTNGDKGVYVKQGTAWSERVMQEIKIERGTGSASVGTSATIIRVDFPVGVFSSAPAVNVQGNSPSSAGARVYFRVSGESSTGFNIEATFMTAPAGTWAYKWNAIGE